jgi:hypothetical protein
MLAFSSYVFKFGCIFWKVYRYFFQDALKDTKDNTLTKLIVQSFQNKILKLKWTLYIWNIIQGLTKLCEGQGGR